MKTPDIIVRKEGKTWNIECKKAIKDRRLYLPGNRERTKDDFSHRNRLIETKYFVRYHILCRTRDFTRYFLKDLLERKLPMALSGKVVSNQQVDIDLAFVNISAMKQHLENYSVKYGSPSKQINWWKVR